MPQNPLHVAVQAAAAELRKAADLMNVPVKAAGENTDALLFEKRANTYRNLVYLHLVRNTIRE